MEEGESITKGIQHYGLPKTHKDGVALKLILSMIGFSQYKVAKRLTTILQSVLDYYSINCILRTPLISLVS